MAKCLQPFFVDNRKFPKFSTEPKVPVPCGKCPACLQRRSDAWAFRLEYQQRVSDTSCFITLTYNSDYVPISKSGLKTLDKAAFPTFIRKLRKLTFNSIPFKYYAVGEYGTERRRPHYHAILFNLHDIVWSFDADGKEIGFSPSLAKSWSFGVSDIRRCTADSIGYVAKYLHKGKSVPEYLADDRIPEFSLMSKA